MDIATESKSWVDVSSSLINEDYLRDPYPAYEKLRSLRRVIRMVDGAHQIWLFPHYDDVASIQKDKRFLSRRTPELLRLIPREHHHEFQYMADFLDMLVVSHDGEKHTRLRKVMNHGFTAYALNNLKVEVQASVDMLIAKRKEQPEDDLASHMLSAASDDVEQLLSDIELAAQCCLLIINGNETTRNLLSSTLMLLFTHREQKEKLKNNPEFLDSVIEEVLRFESPVQFIRCIASENMDYLSAPIREGDSVVLMLGSSHRDPTHYVQPDSFDVTRDDNKNMAFGYGVHFCIGAVLSRLEAHIALSTLFKRLPALDLADSNQEWQWNMNPAFRGLEKLYLRF